MKNFSKKYLILLVCLLSISFSIVGMFASRISDFEERIENLESDKIALELVIDKHVEKNASLSSIVREQEIELNGLYRPKQIDGPAQFPINRVLAREKDTVLSLASREKTTPDVIYALNPWLEGGALLRVGQAIWIPAQ